MRAATTPKKQLQEFIQKRRSLYSGRSRNQGEAVNRYESHCQLNKVPRVHVALDGQKATVSWDLPWRPDPNQPTLAWKREFNAMLGRFGFEPIEAMGYSGSIYDFPAGSAEELASSVFEVLSRISFVPRTA